MKGPGFRIRHDVRRKWECPGCGSIVRTAVSVSSQKCRCKKDDPIWMKLLEEKRANRPMPTPVSKPDPPPERIVSGKEPTIGSSLLPSIASTLSESPIEATPDTTSNKNTATATAESEKTTSSGRERSRRRGGRRPKDSAKNAEPTAGSPGDQPDSKSTTSSGDAKATGTEDAVTGDGQKKSGRKRKRRRRRKSGPKE